MNRVGVFYKLIIAAAAKDGQEMKFFKAWDKLDGNQI